MPRSRYDELHDRYDPIVSGKSGTRYERLAAMVWKTLHQQSVVIHDVRLLGDSSVSHQIDVRMDRDGIPRRTLIECKDFDIAGDPVGIGILRDFRSVLEDTDADEGVVLTCNGFTRGARVYAKAKGIKLMTLRLVDEADMEGRIKKIVHTLHIRGVVNLTISRLEMTDQDSLAFEAQMSALGSRDTVSTRSDMFFVRGNERVQFNEFLSEGARRIANKEQRGAGVWSGRIEPDEWLIQVGQNVPLPFGSIQFTYELVDETRVSEIVSSRVAEMLLSGFGTHDIIIFGDQLERHRISADGEVI